MTNLIRPVAPRVFRVLSLTAFLRNSPDCSLEGFGPWWEGERYLMASDDFKLALIEDDPDDIHFLERLLRPWPVQIVSFGTGQAALDYLFDGQQPLPGLVLLDLILPQMHGFDVLRQIRHHQKTALLPVVITTNSVQEKDALKYYQIGISGFLVKPVQLADLAVFLQGVGAGRMTGDCRSRPA